MSSYHSLEREVSKTVEILAYVWFESSVSIDPENGGMRGISYPLEQRNGEERIAFGMHKGY